MDESSSIKPVLRDERGHILPGSGPNNPAGAPRQGMSWAGVIRDVMQQTSEQLADEVGRDNELGAAISRLPKGVPFKKLLAARLMQALMFDPTPGLLSALMDREEGKVADKLDLSVRPALKVRAERDEEEDVIDGEVGGV